MTTPSVTNFRIEGLRGGYDVNVQIDGNTLILVGENGSGKTTVLRILFYFLSGRWAALRQFGFSQVSATIDGEVYSLKYEELQNLALHPDERMLRTLPAAQRRRYMEFTQLGKHLEADRLYRNYFSHLQPDLLDINDSAVRDITDRQTRIANILSAQILYLPTYRRIERELSSIVQGYDPDEERRTRVYRQSEDADDYVELVEFGMSDVEKAIGRAVEDIRGFQLAGITRLSLSYLGDVVSQAYKNADRHDIEAASDETIEAVLDRVDETILSTVNKSKLRDIIVSAKTTSNVPSEHEQIIYHYFSRLIRFQRDLEVKERSITAFCDLCSKYIVDKKFIYSSGEFTFRIHSPRINDDIKLSELSSGEKQIVSLFSHLYLSGRDKYFVLIDEPELSLSVPWQRRFLLDIRKGSFCAGIVAVTHSPFIYDNELKSHAHSLGEFISGPDWGNIR